MRVLRWVALATLVGVALVLTGCALLDPPPVAGFSWSPSDPLSRTDVQFTDTSSDSGFLGAGGVVSWNWDFGDNSTSSAQNPKHEYQKGGTYTVKLTVTDANGNTAALQKTITVVASLDGRWTGNITDIFYNSWSIMLDLNHSLTGGITGMITIGRNTQPITGASFNPNTSEVQIAAASMDLILRGTLDASETRISGFWYDDDTGVRGEDFTVSR